MPATDDAEAQGPFTSRRVFLQATIAAAALLPTTGAAAAGFQVLELDRIVIDDRFPEAIAFGRDLARQGVAVSAMSGDLTELWSKDFRAAWRAAPMTLGGLTTPAGLFVLETLAADHRMRVIHRTELPPAGSRDTPLVSWIIAPRPRSASTV